MHQGLTKFGVEIMDYIRLQEAVPQENNKWSGPAGMVEGNGRCRKRRYRVRLYVRGDRMRSELSKIDTTIRIEKERIQDADLILSGWYHLGSSKTR